MSWTGVTDPSSDWGSVSDPSSNWEALSNPSSAWEDIESYVQLDSVVVTLGSLSITLSGRNNTASWSTANDVATSWSEV